MTVRYFSSFGLRNRSASADTAVHVEDNSLSRRRSTHAVREGTGNLIFPGPFDHARGAFVPVPDFLRWQESSSPSSSGGIAI